MKKTTSIQKLNTVLLKGTRAISSDANKLESIPVGQVESDVDLKSIMREVILDEEIRGFYGDIIDALIAGGFHLDGDSAEEDQKRLDKMRWGKHLKKMYWNLLTYQSVPTELIPTVGGEIVDLRVLDTSTITPEMDRKGNIKGWIQTPVDGSKDIRWSPDKIAFIEVDNVTNGFWTIPQVRTLARLIRLKKQILKLQEWLYATNQFRPHMHFKNIGTDDVESLVDAIRGTMKEYDKFLVTTSEEEVSVQQLTSPEIIPILNGHLDKIKNMMLTLIRVPPIIAGSVDSSNRSSSDVQARFAFANRLKSFQKDCEDEINYQIFDRIGIKSRLRHNTIDMKEDREYIDMATSLIQAGAKKDKVVGWLNAKRGMDLPPDLFPTEEEEIKLEEKKQSIFSKLNPFGKDSTRVPKQNSNQFPSRKPKEVDTSNIESGAENHNDK